MRRCAMRRREIVEREHRVHARQRARVTRIDAADQRVRMRAAHERGVQQPGQLDVVDEASAADEQRAVLETRECALRSGGSSSGR